MTRFDGEFAEFYSARFEAVRRTAFALCGDWVEAEEIAQAGFVRLYAKWPRVAGGNADAYLRTVVTRLFLDARRRGRARERLVAEPPERSGPEDTAQVDDRQSLLAALVRVSPRQRATLVLRIVHDLSVEEVARTLGCSTGTVKSQLARGMNALREAYRGAELSERSVRDVG
ncbi:SigE family RNA polymerase sigma factor [Actinophytocola sp.]|uniref:SigE family RNA polymerase sigma factor n=1 Tax=Actinophytocola sp. TaxID=1872138 RepID=UPI003899E52F